MGGRGYPGKGGENYYSLAKQTTPREREEGANGARERLFNIYPRERIPERD